MTDGLRHKIGDYTVGWISALFIEQAAATAMLDEEHPLPEDFRADEHDRNLYSFGRIGSNNIVFTCMNAGQYGNVSAAWAAADLTRKFPNLRFGLLVGIGGGVPSDSADIRLGDVVISTPTHILGGVVQCDLGRLTSGGVQRTGSLNSPPSLLLSAVSKIRAREVLGQNPVARHLSVFNLLPDSPFNRDRAGNDILYDGESPKTRAPRESIDPVCHYGTIASVNMVIKDSAVRDRISNELGGVLCFEMEAAGLMNHFPSLVVRGICDYSDSHKNKNWQPYAAGAAAPMQRSSWKVAEQEIPLITSRLPQQKTKGMGGLVGARIDRRGEKKVQEETEDSGKATASEAKKESSPVDGPEHLPTNLDPLIRTPRPGTTFTLFGNTYNFYSAVYIGNGTVMESIVNNQGGSIKNSGGSMFLGNRAGPISSRNIQQSRKVATRAFRPTLTALNMLFKATMVSFECSRWPESLLDSQGKYEEAETMYRRALEAREKVLGPEHPHTLTNISSIGSVLDNQGKFKELEAMHRRALVRRESVLGRDRRNCNRD